MSLSKIFQIWKELDRQIYGNAAENAAEGAGIVCTIAGTWCFMAEFEGQP